MECTAVCLGLGGGESSSDEISIISMGSGRDRGFSFFFLKAFLNGTVDSASEGVREIMSVECWVAGAFRD